MMFCPHVPQENQHTIFHHIQTFHVKSINDTSSKHIKPLWLSTASGGPIYDKSALQDVDQNPTLHLCTPATVCTDQGTQFVSQEFKQFSMQYRFEVQHSSPRYPQSNGFSEAMVKVAKGIMEKAEESGSDPHLAMLIYRATPIRAGQLSPGEMLSQRKYRALLPIHQYLHPNLEISSEAQIAQKQAQRDDYNRTAKKLQDLQQFQSVRFQLDPKKPIW